MKNFKRLFVVLITVVLGAYGVINFRNVTGSIRLGRDISSGYQTKMMLPSVDEVTKEQDRDVLKSRLNHFGIDDAVITSQDDMLFSVEYSTSTDVKLIQDLVSSKGTISIRDTKDNYIANGRELFSSATIKKQGDNTFITFGVKDKNLLATTTSLVSASGQNEMMVVWIDFQEGVDSYNAESTKNTPKFLAAASVNKAMKESQISMRTLSSGDTLKAKVALVNGGEYTAEAVSPITFSLSSVYSTDYVEMLKLTVLVGAGIVVLALLVKYKAAGLAASAAIGFSAFYTGMFFRTVDGVITSSTIVGFSLCLFLSLLYVIGFIGVMKQELASGRSGSNAYAEAIKVNRRYNVTVVLMMIGFSVVYLTSAGALRSFSSMMVLGGLASLIFGIWYLRMCVSMLLINNKNEAALFGVSEKDIPDVAKGEERVKSTKLNSFNYTSKFKTASIVAIILAVVGAGFMGFSYANHGTIFNTTEEFGGGAEILAVGDFSEEALVQILSDQGIKYSTKQTGEINDSPITKYYVSKVSDEQFTNIESGLLSIPAAKMYKVSSGEALPFVGQSIIAISFGLLAASLVVLLVNKGRSFVLVLVNSLISVALVLALQAILPGLVDQSIASTVLLTLIASYVFSVYVDNNAKIALKKLRSNKKSSKDDYKIAMNEGLQKSSTLIVSTSILLTVFGLVTNGLAFKVYPFVWLIVCFSSLFIYGFMWVAMFSKEKHKEPKNNKHNDKDKKTSKVREVEEMIIPGMNDY